MTSRALVSKSWTNSASSLDPSPRVRCVNETMSANPTARGSGKLVLVDRGGPRVGELDREPSRDRGELAAPRVQELLLEDRRELGQPVEDEEARARVVEVEPARHVLDERLDLPQHEPLGGVPGGPDEGRQGALVEPFRRGEVEHVRERLRVPLGERVLLPLGEGEAERLPVGAHPVRPDARALGEPLDGQGAGSPEERLVEHGLGRLGVRGRLAALPAVRRRGGGDGLVLLRVHGHPAILFLGPGR